MGEFKDNVTIENGTATFTVPSSYLPEGNYTVSVDYAGDRNYNSASITTPAFPVRYSNSTDLQALIDEAVANNQTEVNLTHDYKFTENDTAVVIPSNITINGNGHVIDAQNNTGILNVTGDNVTVNDVVFVGGNSTEGGAIYWEDDNGTIANSTFVGNNATAGGAVYSDGDNLTITDSTFTDNTAYSGASVFIDGNNTSISNSTFTDNTAYSGAGVFIDGNNTSISNSTFTNNTADDGSPGIAVNGGNLSYVDNATASNSDKSFLNVITSINVTASDGYEDQIPVVITVTTNTKYGTVVATVGGKNYTCEISNGTGKITISNLAIDSYNNVVISYPSNDNYTSAQTTVNFAVHENMANIINSDVTKDYNSGYNYKARIIGVDGKPVGAGVVFKITLGGKTQSYKTDANGYITIKLDKYYVPAKYTIKLSWKGVSTKHVITVKQILKVKKTIKIKKSAVKLKIKAKLKSSNGKSLKKKKIKFKFRGKTYTAKTNKKGIAKLLLRRKCLRNSKPVKNIR